MKFTETEFNALNKTPITIITTSPEKTITMWRVLGRGDCTADFDTRYVNYGVTLTFQNNHFNWGCEFLNQAKLAAGVLRDANHNASPNVTQYDYPDETHMPLSIAVTGRQAIASYMKLFYDEDRHIKQNGGTRNYVAQLLDVKKDTISSYWNRTRWDGCIECGNENTTTNKITNNETTYRITECGDCGHYFTNRDERRQIHSHSPPPNTPYKACGETLERKQITTGENTYYIWECNECGFTTGEPDRHPTTNTTQSKST